MAKTIGILTGGGDSAAINMAIKAIVKRLAQGGFRAVGIKDGWKGLVEGATCELTLPDVEEIWSLSGTILGTSRTNPFKTGDAQKVVDNSKSLGLDGLIALGGDDTLGVAGRLAEFGLQVIGIPQTIDNDVYGTDYCLGFDTAVQMTVQAIQQVRSSNISHAADMLIEVMGRDTGWIAATAAMLVGADYFMIPELPVNFDEVSRIIKQRRATGARASLVLVAEGIKIPENRRLSETVDAFGNIALAGISYTVATELRARSGRELRVVVLSYLQRGGFPTVHDLIMATRMGVTAAELIMVGRSGSMVCLHGSEITTISLPDIVGRRRSVPADFIELARSMIV